MSAAGEGPYRLGGIANEILNGKDEFNVGKGASVQRRRHGATYALKNCNALPTMVVVVAILKEFRGQNVELNQNLA